MAEAPTFDIPQDDSYLLWLSPRDFAVDDSVWNQSQIEDEFSFEPPDESFAPTDTSWLKFAGAAPALFPRWSPAPFSPWSSLGTPTSLSTAANNTLAFEGAAAGGTSVSALTYLGLFVAAAGIGYSIGRGIRYVYDSRYDIADWWHEATYEPLDLEYYQQKFLAEGRSQTENIEQEKELEFWIRKSIEDGGIMIQTDGEDLETVIRRMVRDRILTMKIQAILVELFWRRQNNPQAYIGDLEAELNSLVSESRMLYPTLDVAPGTTMSAAASKSTASARTGAVTFLDSPEERQRLKELLGRLTNPASNEDFRRDLQTLRQLCNRLRIDHRAVNKALRQLESQQWDHASCPKWQRLSLPNQIDLARRLLEIRGSHNATSRRAMVAEIARGLDNGPAQPKPHQTIVERSIDPQLIETLRSHLTPQQIATWERLQQAFPNGGTDPISRITGDRADDLRYAAYKEPFVSLIAVLLNSLNIYIEHHRLDSIQTMQSDQFLNRWFNPNVSHDEIPSRRAIPSLTGDFSRNLNRLVGCIYEFRGQVRMSSQRRTFNATPADSQLATVIGGSARINPDGLYHGFTTGGMPADYLVEIKSMQGVQLADEPFLDPQMWRFVSWRGHPKGTAMRQFQRTATVMNRNPRLGWHLILITSRGRGIKQPDKVQAMRIHIAESLHYSGYSEEETISIMSRVRVTVLTTKPPQVRSQ